MDLVPAPLAGSRVTQGWAQQATDTANSLAATVLNIVHGSADLPQSSFVSGIKTAIGTYYRSSSVAVAFPAGSFVSPPVVVCSAGGASPGNLIEVSITHLTADGFIACCARFDNPSAATTFEWMAMAATQ